MPQKTVPALTAGICFIAALFFFGPGPGGASAQTDLSVFQKEGVSDEQQSQDRQECHLQATQKVGRSTEDNGEFRRHPDPLVGRTRDDRAYRKEREQVEGWKHKTEYNRAVRSCLENRGYKINETAAETPRQKRP